MTMNHTAMVMCILGSTFLLAILDDTTASDKFFQTGGRFGKRHNEHISGTKSMYLLIIVIIITYDCTIIIIRTVKHNERFARYSG